MTIEATLERIAEGVEAILAKMSHIDAAVSETPEPEKPKAETKAKAKPAAAEESAEVPDKGDVQKALKALQGRTDAATAKDLLASFDGAKTISQVPEEQWAALIEAANNG